MGTINTCFEWGDMLHMPYFSTSNRELIEVIENNKGIIPQMFVIYIFLFFF